MANLNPIRTRSILDQEQQKRLCQMYLDGVRRVDLSKEFNLFPTQIYAYLRKNGIQNNRHRLISRLCIICGARRPMPAYSPNNNWRGIPTCGDVACKAILLVRPDLCTPKNTRCSGTSKAKHRNCNPWDFLVNIDIIDSLTRLTESELLALERAFSLREDARGLDLPETARKALWGRLSNLTIAVRFVSEGAATTAVTLRRQGPLKDFFQQFFGREAEPADVRCFDVLYLWRCECPEQTSYVVRSIGELPVLPGDYGVCPRCGAAALEVA